MALENDIATARGIPSPDPNVEAVRERAAIGRTKYGTDTTRTDIDLRGWLRHLQEELLDAAVYVERLLRDVR